jgi:predicted O-methyltransferase YrrM
MTKLVIEETKPDRDFLETVKPHISGSTMSEEALWYMTQLVAHEKPEAILELGSGVSSIAFAYAQENFKRLYSIDDSAKYLSISKNNVSKHFPHSLEKIQFINAPIETFKFQGKTFETYSPNTLKSYIQPDSIDFLLIDGPYARMYGRVSVLPLVARYLKQNVLIVLDDASRSTEVEAVEGWKRIWGEELEVLRQFDWRKGLTVFRLKDPRKMRLMPFGFPSFVKSLLR